MYNFYWYGKENSIKEYFKPIDKTLRPNKESSKNWDDTENLYIEGDNLEVLKLLQKSYFGKIKMIYIDPPYNTGKDFVYKDNFRDNIANYKDITSQTTIANPEVNGRYHTDWLNMMYPRLKLARNLLTDDGVIFISIDDHEIAQLKLLCNEVFGEENLKCIFTWINSADEINNESEYIKINGANSGDLKKGHEYILCYTKKIKKFKFNTTIKNKETFLKREITKNGNSYSTIKLPKGVTFRDKITKEFKDYVGGEKERIFLSNKMQVVDGVLQNDVELKGSFGERNLWIEKFLNGEDIYDTKGQKILDLTLTSTGVLKIIKEKHGEIITDVISNVGNVASETKKLNSMLNTSIDKIYPKPINLIRSLIEFSCDKNSIILDFFSGSSTTAHSIMQLNFNDTGNRKFIMVQLPELIEEKSEAYKAGYKNICEIGKERIRRAGDRIVSETEKTDLDIGFKVFKLIGDDDMFYNVLDNDAVEVKIIKRPKIKDSIRIKMDGETYYITEDEDNYIVFTYTKGQTDVVASIFNKEDCMGVDYIELERVYTDKLVEFNQGWYHSNYVTVRILDEIYKIINN